MFKNYLKVSFRSLWRNKFFSGINIFGLAIGLAVYLLIALFVADELSYDRYNIKADRIYRVNPDIRVNGLTYNDRVAPAPLGPTLVKEYPDIEKAVRIEYDGDGPMLVKKGEVTLQEQHACFADPTLFDVFTLPMVAGDPATALKGPQSIVLSESMAKKYFGSTDVVGKTLLTDNVNLYTITGVIKDMPPASHLHLDFIRAMPNDLEPNWLNNEYATYVLVRPGVSEAQLDHDLDGIAATHIQPALQQVIHSNFADLAKKGDYLRYTTIPLTRIHLYSTLPAEVEPSGNIQYVYIFIAIGVLILLLACVNFMNLSTSQFAGRSREVGVRKVLGSRRMELVMQFLVESLITSGLALAMAVTMAVLLLPYLSQLAGKHLSLSVLPVGWWPPCLLGTIVVVALLAGSYPAFFLSAFKPVQVLVLRNTASLSAHARDFKQQILNLPGVESGTMAAVLPTETQFNQNSFGKDASMNANQTVGLSDWAVDADYIPTLGMKIVMGRNFSPLLPTDSGALIINETAASLLGWKDPLLHKLYESGDNGGPVVGRPIIGVAKDFNAGSQRNKIRPMVLRLMERRDEMAFRVHTDHLPALIAQIETKYHAVDKMEGQPFVYSFLDADFDRLYVSEQRTGRLFGSFAAFAILIASLGLFGLVTYAAEQRTREIGIRKVLGASVTGIVGLLSADFLRLVGLSVLVASPLAWWLMRQWLQGFAYRAALSGWIFGGAALMALVIALGTVSVQALRAARAVGRISMRSVFFLISRDLHMQVGRGAKRPWS